MEGCIFNIQKFSVHDGPGIRTTVFMKGCSLSCIWCHNPESIERRPQLQFFPQKCIGCGRCVELCPAKAHIRHEGGVAFVRELCKNCGRCAEECYAEALVMAGRYVSVDEVIAEVEKDREFYKNSGGGVTFSGGEPLLQADFLKCLLEECRKRGFHTAVDTAGNVPWENFEAVMGNADLFLYDVKAFSEEKHREATGSGNARILENLKKLSGLQAEIWIRIPVAPGVNGVQDEMERISDFLAGLQNIKKVELLPFHHLGEGKYKSLGKEYRAKYINPPSEEDMERWRRMFKSKGLAV